MHQTINPHSRHKLSVTVSTQGRSCPVTTKTKRTTRNEKTDAEAAIETSMKQKKTFRNQKAEAYHIWVGRI